MLSTSKFRLPEFLNNEIKGGFKILGLDKKMKRTWKYLPKEYPIPKISQCLYKYKVFIAQNYGCGSIGEEISTPGELCTETFLEIGPFETKLEAENVIKYIKTKFFGTLVGIQKQTQSAVRKVYKYVPLLDFNNNSNINWKKDIKYLDNQLFEKFRLNKDEIEFIKKNILEMN